MNIFKKSHLENEKIKKAYDDSENTKELIMSSVATFIIAIPIILLAINWFYILTMRPYLAIMQAGAHLFLIFGIYHVLSIYALKRLRNLETIDYRYPMFVPLIYYFVGIMALALAIALIIVPIFFV